MAQVTDRLGARLGRTGIKMRSLGTAMDTAGLRSRRRLHGELSCRRFGFANSVILVKARQFFHLKWTPCRHGFSAVIVRYGIYVCFHPLSDASAQIKVSQTFPAGRCQTVPDEPASLAHPQRRVRWLVAPVPDFGAPRGQFPEWRSASMQKVG